MPTIIPPRKHISLAFSKGAPTYAHNASVQREILVKLAAKLPQKNLRGPWIDLGCGTGLLETMLSGPQTKVPIFCVDLARESLKMLARQNDRPDIYRIQADIDQLPFKPEIFSMAVMSSVIQWLPNPSLSISRANSLLSRGGRLLFSVFCKGTYSELFTLRTEKGLPVPIELLCEKSISSLIEKTGLNIIDLEIYKTKSYFTSAWGVLKNISAIGATAVVGPRLLKKQLLSLCEEYERRFNTRHGVPVSYTVAIGMAQKGIGF